MNKDTPANSAVVGMNLYAKGETKYEIMFRSVLAGLCANSRTTKELACDGTIVYYAKVITDYAFEELEKREGE
jgi:hypothetical protein